jgi:hypothetical protein
VTGQASQACARLVPDHERLRTTDPPRWSRPLLEGGHRKPVGALCHCEPSPGQPWAQPATTRNTRSLGQPLLCRAGARDCPFVHRALRLPAGPGDVGHVTSFARR